MADEGYRSGFVTLVGRPNVGKSTLVNALTGQKVAIVSPRAQTTRTRICGIVTREDAQVVLVDTPGMTKGVDALRRVMRRTTEGAAAGTDVALVVMEMRSRRPQLASEDREVIATARKGTGQLVVALNKIDCWPDKRALLPWIEVCAQAPGVDVVVPISAKLEDGLDRLLEEVVVRLPAGPPLFPSDMVTDQAERFLCAELVREQLLQQTRQEVPHASAVVIETFEDRRRGDGGMCHIEGRIILERESQKGIVVGRGGRQIKAIGETARREIEVMLGCRVFLHLTVHVNKNWRQREAAVTGFGYGETET